MNIGRAMRAMLLAALAAGPAMAAGCAADSEAESAADTARAATATSAVPQASGLTKTTPAIATTATSQPLENVAPAATAASAATADTLSNVVTPRPSVRFTEDQVKELAGLVAELHTNMGTLVIGLLPEKAPNHVANFVELARSGFYNGTVFHRVIPGLFIQAGDPTGTGDGGPGYTIRAEFNDEPHVRGTVSMARLRHPDTAGSQFFICLAPHSYLDGAYTAFGQVLAGDEVLERIEAVGRLTPQGTPTETVTLEQVLIRPRSEAERPTASRQP